MKVLVREEPNKGPNEYPYDDEHIRLFGLTEYDKADLESDKVVWDNGVAYTLEDSDE